MSRKHVKVKLNKFSFVELLDLLRLLCVLTTASRTFRVLLSQVVVFDTINQSTVLCSPFDSWVCQFVSRRLTSVGGWSDLQHMLWIEVVFIHEKSLPCNVCK